jgi:hypothetical protein
MRINEITDAQGQLELLRTVIDNTWGAIAQQAEQEKRAEAERKAQAKLKPRSRKAVKAPYASPPPPLKKPKPLTANKPTSNPTLANPNTDNTIKRMPSLHPSDTQATPKNALNVPKDGYLDMNIDAVQNDERGDDRHSKNDIATHKKPATTF